MQQPVKQESGQDDADCHQQFLIKSNIRLVKVEDDYVVFESERNAMENLNGSALSFAYAASGAIINVKYILYIRSFLHLINYYIDRRFWRRGHCPIAIFQPLGCKNNA